MAGHTIKIYAVDTVKKSANIGSFQEKMYINEVMCKQIY